MEKTVRLFIPACISAAVLFVAIFAYADLREDRSAAREERIPGQYIVVFKDSVTDVETAENDIVSRVRGERLDSYRHALNGFAARISLADLETVKNDPRVAFVSEDRVVSIADSTRSPQADSRTSSQASRGERDASTLSHRNGTVSIQSQTLPTGIDRINNVENKTNKGAGVHVAVIDTGIQTDHPDLKSNIAGGKNCSTGTSYNDGNGHGTHVAGTIAALDNGAGVVGVAPEAKLWAVRVLNNSGSGTWSSVICGIDFVTSKAPANGGPITVANLSLGGGGSSDNNCGMTTTGPGSNDALHKAICRARNAGVTIVVAAGNSGVNAATQVPAAYDDAVITVSALADSNGKAGGGGAGTSYGADDTFASFSNYGSAIVDIGAPGVNIYSTWLKSGYKTISGTSMASPHVAGAAALYIATHPITSPTSWRVVRDALVAAGEPLDGGHTDPSLDHPEPVLLVDTL